MPIVNLDNEIYRNYDKIIAKTIEHFSKNLPNHGKIRLKGFDRTNKEHLFILRVALMTRDLYKTPVEIACSWWDGTVINWKIGRKFDKVGIVKKFTPNGLWVPSLIGLIKSEIMKEEHFRARLDDVYDVYYKGDCG